MAFETGKGESGEIGLPNDDLKSRKSLVEKLTPEIRFTYSGPLFKTYFSISSMVKL